MGGICSPDANNARVLGAESGRAVRGGSGSRSIDLLLRNDWTNPKAGAAVRPMSMTLVLPSSPVLGRKEYVVPHSRSHSHPHPHPNPPPNWTLPGLGWAGVRLGLDFGPGDLPGVPPLERYSG